MNSPGDSISGPTTRPKRPGRFFFGATFFPASVALPN